MLDRSRDDVLALFGVHLGHAQDRKVVALSCAARENHFFVGCTDQLRDLSARSFDRCFSGPTKLVVAARSIAEDFRKIWSHRPENFRIDRSGRMIVEIDRKLHKAAFS